MTKRCLGNFDLINLPSFNHFENPRSILNNLEWVVLSFISLISLQCLILYVDDEACCFNDVIQADYSLQGRGREDLRRLSGDYSLDSSHVIILE